jgi:cellulose/xylan binding protein with CBM9 domain/type IX secretion system substrate protein
MKNYLLSLLFLAFAGFAFGQTQVSSTVYLDWEDVQDPLIEEFDVTTSELAVANPSGDGTVGKIVKAGDKFWGGINIYFGGDVTFTDANDKFSIDFYTEDAGINDSILFKFQLFNRYGGVTTIEVDQYYTDANDTETGVWKTLEFSLGGDTLVGESYNQMVIFFGWTYSSDGDTYYYDNITGPYLDTYDDTDVTFTITDKFNNATDVGLFVNGDAKTLTKDGNVYTNTTALASYNILGGLSQGKYEVVYTHKANGVEMRDTTSVLAGSATGAQELLQLIIVEALEDGTANAISVGDTPPTIDGTIDAVWGNAKTHSLQERGWWGSPSGLYSTFKIMWDIDNVYLLYVIEDATPYNGAGDPWMNDCMETFFDMNQSATTPYDADDFQIRNTRGLDTWTGSANVTDTWAADVERAQVEMTDGSGYIIELAIPWTSLSSTFLPIAGTEFNYDCSSTDVLSGGGARVFREAWTTNQDVAYMNTEFFGTITLSAETIEVSVQELQIPNLTVYPNPVIDQVNIKADNEISEVNVYDITGREVYSLANINEKTVSMNVNDLFVNAIYIVKITDVKGNTSARKITIQ